MTIESNLVDALRGPSLNSPDPWRRQAHIIADGIDRSGLGALITREMSGNIRETQLSADRVEQAVMRSATMLSSDISALSAAVARQTLVLSALEDAIRNPRATQARELYERGLKSLRAGWGQEAVRDLQESVGATQNPYDVSAQFVLGLALAVESQPAASGDAFSLAFRYSSDDPGLNSLAAGAGLLGCRAYLDAGDETSAKSLVAAALERIPDCAELWFMRASLHRDSVALERALSLAPELSLDAVALDLPEAREVSEQIAERGPIASMHDINELCRRTDLPAMDLPPREDVAASSTVYPTWAGMVVPGLRQAIAKHHTEMSAVRSSIASAEATVDSKPASVTASHAWLKWVIGFGVPTAILIGVGSWVGAGLSRFDLAPLILGALIFFATPWITMSAVGLVSTATKNSEKENRETTRRMGAAREAERDLVRLRQEQSSLLLPESAVLEIESLLKRAVPPRVYPLTQP